MDEKGIKTALKSSEVQRQTVDFAEKIPAKNSVAISDHQPSLFASADVSSKEEAAPAESGRVSNETAGLGLERKPGRPKGAKNKSTKEWIEYYLNTIKESPLIFLGRIYTEKTDLLARRLSCKREDALKMQIGAANAVLPYVHQKQPIAIETTSEELPTIQIFTSPTVYQQINNGNNQIKKEIVVDGIASTTVEEIPLKINNLDIDDNSKSENKV